MKRLTHVASDGRAKMVDVSAKPLSHREAVASGRIELQAATLKLIAADRIAKGNVFATARLAGIQAAKQTAHLIPLCHTLGLSHVEIRLTSGGAFIEATCTARTTAQTGVEMEALTGVDRRAPHHLRHVQGGRQEDEDRRDHAPEENEIGRRTMFVIPIRQSAERDLAIAMRAFRCLKTQIARVRSLAVCAARDDNARVNAETRPLNRP